MPRNAKKVTRNAFSTHYRRLPLEWSQNILPDLTLCSEQFPRTLFRHMRGSFG